MTDFVKKASLTELENKFTDISNLATKTALTTVENKIPDVNNLATKTALLAVENKITDVTNLATKTESTVVENKIHDANSLANRLIIRYQVLLVKLLKIRVAEIDNKVSSLAGKIAENKTKNVYIENELKKLIFAKKAKIWLFFFRQTYSLTDQMVLKLL